MRGNDELDEEVDGPPINSTRSIMTPYGEQDENGTDLSLIRSQLTRTPAERLAIAERASAETLWLNEIGRRTRRIPPPASR